MAIRIKLEPGAAKPLYQTYGSVGFDIAGLETIDIEAGETALVRTGLTVETPPGLALLVIPRSSLYKRYGVIMPHSIGVIDQDYCGEDDEILLQLENVCDEAVTIPYGDRLAQGIFVRISRSEFEVVEYIESKSRGGFGSTNI